MPKTTDDLIHALHRERIGGSMVAGILGVSPWDSPYSIYQTMRGEVPDKEETPQMRRGKRHEQTVLDELALRTGLPVVPGITIKRDDWGFPTVAQIDGFVDDADGRQPAEAKTTNFFAADDWKGAEPPLHYYVQVQWQIAHADAARAYVACMWGLDEDQYAQQIVTRDDEVIHTLMEKCRRFFHDNVVAGVPPMVDGHPATTTAVRQRYPRSTPEMALVLDDQQAVLLEARQHAVAQIERWTEAKDEHENLLKVLLGDAEAAVAPGWTISWKTQTKTTVDTKKLRAEQPDLVAPYLKTSDSRPFIVKPAKP